MTEKETPQWPVWAEQERLDDLAWIKHNADAFWSMAQAGYEAVGRGVVVVNIAHQASEAGHPLSYCPQDAIDLLDLETAGQAVQAYHPQEEFVTLLIKPEDRISVYQLQLIMPENDVRLQSPLILKEKSPLATSAPPDLETLMTWEWEGGCEATDGCWVEPDGAPRNGEVN